MSRIPKIIIIGASAGGVTAIQFLLSRLSRGFLIPIVVLQHMPAVSRVGIENVYTAPPGCKLVEVEDKMAILPKTIYFATPNYHLLIERDLTFSLSQDELVHFSRPSIDVLFESAAEKVGVDAVGVLLTGANQDGADGLAKIHQHGGITVVQDPQEAEVDIMPKSALSRFVPDRILSLAGISNFFEDLLVNGFAKGEAPENRVNT